jgi:hypothetical protein
MDDEQKPVFYSIECAMRSDTNRALFHIANAVNCDEIRRNLDSWLKHTLIDGGNNTAYRKYPEVKIYIYMVNERNSQHAVKCNAYAKCIPKKFCIKKPNKASRKFDTA